jgi:ATP-dependent Clp protease ATP-binding subunit ClpC
VFERFTQRAREAVLFAHDESRTFGHNYIGTEHLLVGLLRDGESAASRVLEANGIDLTRALARLEQLVGRGDWGATRDRGFTPKAKLAIELAVAEADAHGDSNVDTEHVLLGLARVEDSIAARILAELGSPPRAIADAVLGLLGPPTGLPRAPGK